MTPLAAAVAELIALGIEGDALVAAIGRMEQSMYIGRTDTDTRKERNRRYYEKKKQTAERLKASEKRLKTSENEASENRLKAPESVLIQTPLARVRDNITNSVDRPYHTTLNNADERSRSDDLEWPPVDPVDRRYVDRLEGMLRTAAGKSLNVAAPKLMVVAPILGLGRPGNGPICDLYTDILPVVAACGARAAPGSIKAWDYFTEPIREARDRRLAGAPATQEIRHERPDAKSARFDRRQASHAADFAGSELAVDLRAERRARYL